jgi:ferredoxin
MALKMKTMPATQTSPFFITRVGPDQHLVRSWADQPLLLALEQGGIDWPSSCRNGTCRTCIGQLDDGEVHYHIEWPGLSAQEKTEGYVLPCVAFPRTDTSLRR